MYSATVTVTPPENEAVSIKVFSMQNNDQNARTVTEITAQQLQGSLVHCLRSGGECWGAANPTAITRARANLWWPN